MNRREDPAGPPHPPIRSGLAEVSILDAGRSDPPVKPTSEVAHQPGQQPAVLLYADRAERYLRQRGIKYDPHRMSIDRLTPRQRRRALKTEGKQLRRLEDGLKALRRSAARRDQERRETTVAPAQGRAWETPATRTV